MSAMRSCRAQSSRPSAGALPQQLAAQIMAASLAVETSKSLQLFSSEWDVFVQFCLFAFLKFHLAVFVLPGGLWYTVDDD